MNTLLTALHNRAPDDIVIHNGELEITASALTTSIAQLGAQLIAENIERLGLLAGNSPAWIITDIACLAENICLLPMPKFFSNTQLEHSLITAGINAVLTDDPIRVTDIVGGPQMIRETRQLQGLTLLHLDWQQTPNLPAGTQKITFTSGSTGEPRGVCLSADNQLNVAKALATKLPFESPQHLCLLPLSTLLENIGGVYCPLLVGGTISIPELAEKNTASAVGPGMLDMLRGIQRHRPTSMILLPQMLVGLLAAIEEGWQPPAELKFIAVGGAKVSAGLIRMAREHGLPVYEGYGLSESGSVACLNVPGNDRVGSVGTPLPHVNLFIENGEVFITGNTFLGYAGQPESWGKNTVTTGDLGTLDDEGFLNLKGRRKNLLISAMGRNISPEWVESELLSANEITQCVVFGDARPFCSALIVCNDDAVTETRIQQIVNDVNEQLPDYARIRRWQRLSTPLTAENGLYTDNGRPNRINIAHHFAQTIDSFYDGKTTT